MVSEAAEWEERRGEKEGRIGYGTSTDPDPEDNNWMLISRAPSDHTN